jgi:hypothetical protein
MDIPAINAHLADAKTSIDDALALINAPNGGGGGTETVVKAGEALQPALDKGGTISLEAGATWEGTYTVRKDTVLKGNGATINGVNDAAVIILPGTSNVTIQDLIGHTKTDQRVFLIGKNDTNQTLIDQVPTNINWIRCKIPTYRGKRGFEMNGTGKFLECEVADLWDPAGRDSQAIGISNTTGPVTVDGGSYSAGSEIIMVGGDTIKLPAGTVQTGLTVQNTRLYRPDSWRTDGVKRGVKNCIEFKAGVDIVLRNTTLDGCWADGQVGFAIVLTPRAKMWVDNVLIEAVTIKNCTAVAQIMGQDNTTHTKVPISKVVIRGCNANVSKAHGGYGCLSNITAGVREVTFEANTFTMDSDYCTDYQRLNYMDENGVLVPAAKLGLLSFKSNTMEAPNGPGKYSFRFEGQVNGNKWNLCCDSCVVEGNGFPNAAAALKTNFPNNTWV